MIDFSEYEQKTVLVTGGAGCIGSNLCKRLSDLHAGKVIILDNLSSAYEWNIPQAKNIHFIKGDVQDDGILQRVFKDHFSHPNSICRHEDARKAEPQQVATLASVIIDMTEQDFYLTQGPPCQNEYYKLQSQCLLTD